MTNSDIDITSNKFEKHMNIQDHNQHMNINQQKNCYLVRNWFLFLNQVVMRSLDYVVLNTR